MDVRYEHIYFKANTEFFPSSQLLKQNKTNLSIPKKISQYNM